MGFSARSRSALPTTAPPRPFTKATASSNKLRDPLNAGHVADGKRVDAKWLANRLAAVAAPKGPPIISTRGIG